MTLTRVVRESRRRLYWLRLIVVTWLHVARFGGLPHAAERLRTTEGHLGLARRIGIGQLPDETFPFLALVNQESPRFVCEIGTASGGHLYLLSRALPSVELVIGIDLHIRNGELLDSLLPKAQELHMISGDSTDETVLSSVRSILNGKKLDVLFIDGDHTYAGVRKDFLSYCEFVREGGLIGFHDIVPDDATRYGSKTSNWAGDVPEFWGRIKVKYPAVEFINDRDQNGFGIGVVRYSSRVPLTIDQLRSDLEMASRPKDP